MPAGQNFADPAAALNDGESATLTWNSERIRLCGARLNPFPDRNAVTA